MTTPYARVLGVGSYLPRRVMTNQDFEKILDTSDEWITSRTGIHQRHIAADDETTSSMALMAARQALEMAELDAKEIDMIIIATCSPDMLFPSSACFLQKALGLEPIPAFDLTAACSGFVYSLTVAQQFIRTGAAKTILVVGSEVISRALDWQDRRTCVLFGDGAGAVVVQASEQSGIIDCVLHANGQYTDILNLPNPHYQHAPEDKLRCFLQMQGRELYRIAVTELPNVMTELLERNNLQKEDIDWLIPHQANSRIIELAVKRLDFPMEKVVSTVEKHANTSAASVPLALDVAVRDGRIKRGDKVILEAFGGGITWGAVLLEF
ncbi:MAG: ketoacyl-ACP synthase III [Gammaproteobacteria bacterium]|nr:ketoacyl-ACP synthase III [Gammaproteobacteria bacterium]